MFLCPRPGQGPTWFVVVRGAGPSRARRGMPSWARLRAEQATDDGVESARRPATQAMTGVFAQAGNGDEDHRYERSAHYDCGED